MSERSRLVVASANPGKIAELVELLEDDRLALRYAVEPRPDGLADTIEDGETLEANALKKAREVVAHVGAVAVADDTGLFVEALDGRPGVYTGRYAGEHATYDDNVDKLLSELATVEPGPARRAEFRTVVAAVWPDGHEVVVEGSVVGLISEARRGSEGFGYDPVFIPIEGDGRTFAEMGTAAKHGFSHRARAIDALLGELG